MRTLPSLLSWTVSHLQAWGSVRDVRVLETEAFSEDRFHLKVRALLVEPFQLQIRFYFNRDHLDYAYQLFDDGPVLRWDNKEDAGSQPTAPHHFHNDQSRILESPLNGDPSHDLPLVQAAVAQYLDARGGRGPAHGGTGRRIRR